MKNIRWSRLQMKVANEGCGRRDYFTFSITPGFTLSHVSHMQQMHSCMVPVSKNDKNEVWASPYHPINMPESFQIFSHATYNLHVPLKFFCQIIPPVCLQYQPGLCIGEGFYCRTLLFGTQMRGGLTQSHSDPFPNSKLFKLLKLLKPGQNRQNRVGNPTHCRLSYFLYPAAYPISWFTREKKYKIPPSRGEMPLLQNT